MNLLSIAREQGGHFTASQAEGVGYSNSHQFRCVKNGSWTHIRRGIYRLVSEPESEREDLHILSLFFRRRDGTPSGVFGLETAASIHELGDFMPAKIYVLVPKGFRKRATIPQHVEVVKVNDVIHQISSVGGLQTTTPLRTIIDLLGQVDRDSCEVRKAYKTARSSGLISPALIEKADWISVSELETLKAWEKSDE